MKLFVRVLPVAAMTVLGGCVVVGGPTETRSYTNTGFDAIDAAAGINVVLSQGPFDVKAQAPEGNVDRIIVEQDGATLKLRRKQEFTWFGGNGHYVVNVSAPAITKLTVSGGADLETGALAADTLELSASGGGDLDLRGLKVANLTAASAGGGDISTEGTCTTATISASGGGDFNGKRLACVNVTATAAGGGDIEVGASGVASGDASSGGDVRFYGSPATVNRQVSSGGDVSVEAR